MAERIEVTPEGYEPLDLTGKKVVLTGGTTGIGRATARRLLEMGADVLFCGRDQAHLQDALGEMRGRGGRAVGVMADTGKPEDVEGLFQEADRVLGGVDILINNAAVGAKSVLDMEPDAWREAVNTNLLGYIDCCQQALKRMVPKGEGQIVNVGSMSATVREKGSSVYVATKAGIEGFSEALRKEVNEKGIRVVLIEPGLVGTDMTTDQVPKEGQPRKQAEGAMLTAEDLAACIHYTLIQPRRCDVVLVQIRPHRQEI